MSAAKLICAVLAFCSAVLVADQRQASPPPEYFEIGRHTFIDTGPPFDFYELFIVRPRANSTLIERFTLTPAGCVCLEPAKIEAASARFQGSVASLLGDKNPCTIPEKAVQDELKRRKNGPVFSGANIVLRIPCGDGIRMIRADILDRDMFDASPRTPENTSWTMQLLSRLDQAVGGAGVLDRPILPIPGKKNAPHIDLDPMTLKEIGAGDFDALFSGAPDKPSDLYRAAQFQPPPPTIRLLSVAPVKPEFSPLPEYPALARMAQIEDSVSVKIEIDEKGNVVKIAFDNGHPVLRRAVEEAVRKWRFPSTLHREEVHATLEFALNCRCK